MRHKFTGNVQHVEILNSLNFINSEFIEIIDTVCGYRIELGMSLQKLVESYNAIYLHQFNIMYSQKGEKDI